jgi:hypothetical protein
MIKRIETETVIDRQKRNFKPCKEREYTEQRRLKNRIRKKKIDIITERKSEKEKEMEQRNLKILNFTQRLKCSGAASKTLYFL